jgi:hypothetical protein
MVINKHFNRFETDHAHVYMNNTGTRSKQKETYEGFLKCKLVHCSGYSIIVPDIILMEQPNQYWIQPLHFLPNILQKQDHNIEGRLYIDISCSETLQVDFNNFDLIKGFSKAS